MADKIHTGMRIDPDQLDELKYTAWHDRRTFTSVMDIAIEKYLSDWKKKNGTITPALIEKAKIK